VLTTCYIPAGVALMAIFHDLAVHFSYAGRIEKLWSVAGGLPDSPTELKLKVGMSVHTMR
jgi:hypothetical protein